MLDDLARQPVLGFNDDLDNLVKVDVLEVKGVKDPRKRSAGVVGVDDDLETAREESAVEQVLVKQVGQWLALRLLSEQDGLEVLVVKGRSHAKPHASESFVRSRMACRLVGRHVLLAKRISHLLDTLGDRFGGIVVTRSKEFFQLDARLRLPPSQQLREPRHEVGGLGDGRDVHLLFALDVVLAAQGCLRGKGGGGVELRGQVALGHRL